MTQQPPLNQTRSFVWLSTTTSVRDRIPSAMACFEVAAAISAYWATAIYFETSTNLWISICIAPLLLLRSDQSILLGAKWYVSFVSKSGSLDNATVGTLLRSADFYAGTLILISLSTLASYALTLLWLPSYTGIGAILRGIGISIFSLQIASFATTATIGLHVGFTRSGSERLEGFLAALGVAVGSLVATGPSSGTIALSLGAFAAIILSKTVIGQLIFLIPTGMGFWLKTLIIRFGATARYARIGFWQIPTNFTYTLFIIDIRHPTALMPGPNGNDLSSTKYFYEEYQSSERRSRKFTALVLLSVATIPAYLYRLTIKSTCWLYLPLIYIASAKELAFSHEHLLDRLGRSPWERGRQVLALVTFAAFVITIAIFNLTKIPSFLDEKFISPVEYLFLLDFPWKKPWQAFNLLSAGISLYLWFQAGSLRVDLRHAQSAEARAIVDQEVEWIKFWMRIRNLSSIILILVLTVHVLLVFNAFNVTMYVPNYLWHGLSWFYGEYMPVRFK